MLGSIPAHRWSRCPDAVDGWRNSSQLPMGFWWFWWQNSNNWVIWGEWTIIAKHHVVGWALMVDLCSIRLLSRRWLTLGDRQPRRPLSLRRSVTLSLFPDWDWLLQLEIAKDRPRDWDPTDPQLITDPTGCKVLTIKKKGLIIYNRYWQYHFVTK